MTVAQTKPTAEARALLGCPSWCTFDHFGPTATEAGEHLRSLAREVRGHDVTLCLGRRAHP
jgi:hypothetical protein